MMNASSSFLTCFCALANMLSFRICLIYVSYTPYILFVYALYTIRICLVYHSYMPCIPFVFALYTKCISLYNVFILWVEPYITAFLKLYHLISITRARRIAFCIQHVIGRTCHFFARVYLCMRVLVNGIFMFFFASQICVFSYVALL